MIVRSLLCQEVVRLFIFFSETKHDEQFLRNGAIPKVRYQGDLKETEHDGNGYVGRGRVDTQLVSHIRPRPVTHNCRFGYLNIITFPVEKYRISHKKEYVK
jgi:hypothetical protein